MMRAQRRWILACLVMLVSFSQIACDTVAEITFSKENLDSVTVLGFRAKHCGPVTDPLETCLPPACGTLEFVMTTNQARFLRPELKLENLPARVRPGDNFSIQDISFDRSYVFELVDSDATGCSKDASGVTGDCAGLEKRCTTNADCKADMTCMTFGVQDLPAGDALVGATQGVCASPAVIQPTSASLRYVDLGSDPQPDNDRTSGLRHSGVSLVVAMDNSGSLNGNFGAINRERATDPLGDRVAAMLTFFSELTDDKRATISDSLQLAVFELKGTGQGGVVDVLGETFGSQTGNRTFTVDVGLAENGVNSMTNTSSGESPIWEGMIAIARLFQESQEVRSTYDREVLLFVDSEANASGGNSTAENAINALELADVNAEATVLHLDSLAPTDLSERSGPISDYRQLACERSGFYHYEPYPTALEPQLRQRLGLSYEGKWELEVEIFAGSKAMSDLQPGWYRVGGSMAVGLANETKTFNMSSQRVSTFSDDTFDTRLLIEVTP